MDPNAPETLFDALRECGLYTADQLAAIPEIAAAAGSDLATLAEGLFSRQLLTPYQARKLRFNRISELVLGKYLVLDKVGEGGMGKVFKAIDRTTGQIVALKVVRAHLMANKIIRGRYHREVAAAAALKHPNIVTLLDDGEANGRYYLAMEFVDGSDLSRMVKELGPLPYPEACEYVRQAALGLHHAHKQGLIHRDIKPSNLLVCGERALPGTGGKATVKILDMGLVLSLDALDDPDHTELTRDGTVVGTPDYMAPEQAKNSSTVDHRADLYSLGCTLYTLLSGRPPFPDGSPIDKLLRHQLDPPTDLKTLIPDLPAGVAAIVGRLLAKKPAERFNSAAELAEALARYTPDAEPEVDPLAPPPRRKSGERSRKAVPEGSTIISTSAATAPRPVPMSARSAEPSPAILPRPQTPVVTVRPVETATRSGNFPAFPHTAEPLDAEPLDAEPLNAEPLEAEPVAVPPVRTKPEPRPVVRKEPRPRRTIRRPNRPTKSGIPMSLIVAGVVLGAIVLATVVYAFATRSSKTPPEKSDDVATPNPSPPIIRNDPATPATGMPPPAVSAADGAAAVMVIDPREFWRRADIRPMSRPLAFLQALDANYRFDPRRYTRLTISFSPRAAGQFVVVGEGSDTDPNWAANRELAGVAQPIDVDGQPLLAFGPEAQRVYGAAVATRGIVLGTDGSRVASVAARALTRKPAPGIAADVVAALATPPGLSPPMLTFAADGRFYVPGVGPLADQGIDLATARIWLRDGIFEVEVHLNGPDKERLKDFVSITLWTRVVDQYPVIRPFLTPVTQLAGQTFETRGDTVRMRLTGQWSFAEFQQWAEQLIPDTRD
jgi:serine/threonine protein kinase